MSADEDDDDEDESFVFGPREPMQGQGNPVSRVVRSAWQREEPSSSRSSQWMAMENPAAVPLREFSRGVAPVQKRSGEAQRVFPGQADRFGADEAGILQRKYKKPSVQPAEDIAVVRETVAWRRRLVRDAVRLHGQPWYQFAELVAGKAGVPLDKLVRMDGVFPSSLHEDPQVYSVRGPAGDGNGNFGDTPGQERPLADDSLSDRAAYLADALELELAGPTTGFVDAPEVGQTALERRQARDVDRWAKSARVNGVAFLTPLFTSSREEALVRVRYFAPWLEKAPLEAFTRHASVRVWFAVATGALVNVSRFTGGQAPLRAGDYEKYVDRLDEAVVRIADYTWSERDRTFVLARPQGRFGPWRGSLPAAPRQRAAVPFASKYGGHNFL